MCSCLENRVVIQRKSARRLPNEPRRTASSSNRCPENRVPDRQACVKLRGIAFDLGGVSRGIAVYRGVSPGIADILARCLVWRGGVAVAETIHFHMVSTHCVCEGQSATLPGEGIAVEPPNPL